MPRYYCDYCDTYLTHDSPSVRKQHNAGYKHKANVRSYYQQFEEQQTQSLIDQRIKEHLGQTAAFQQVGGTYNQHLASFQGNPQRPRLPVLPTPIMQMPGGAPLLQGIRPPILPRPPGTLGYGTAPNMPSMVGPPGAPSSSVQLNGLPRPPGVIPSTAVSGSLAALTSNTGPSMINPAMYLANPAAPTSGGFDSFNVSGASGVHRVVPGGNTSASPTTAASQEGYSYAQMPEANRYKQKNQSQYFNVGYQGLG